ncbi:MAG TPA: hypothetical protein PK335_05960 [Draconibacterium sp.]|nr:hypothetical protein [Draconibacterium sp.]
MKRTLIIILVALIAVVAGYIFFTRNDVVFSKESSLYKAVPVSSPLFLEVNSLKSIPLENELLTNLSGIDFISNLLAKVSQSDKIISDLKEIQGSWARRPFILAYDFVGDEKIEPLIISSIKNNNELHGFELLLGEISGVSNPQPSEKRYSSYKIFSFSNPEGKSFYFSAAEGLILFSPELIMVEKGLRQLNSENLTDIQNFNKVNKTAASGSDIACYINHERFAELLGRIINSKTFSEENEFGESVRINLRRKILETKDFASWSEMDMSLTGDMISLNGITAADDSLNHFITVFTGQTAERCNAGKVLPRNTSFYIGYTFSDRDLFFQNLIDYFKMSNTFYEREEHLKKIERRFGDDSRETLKKMVNNEVLAAITDVSTEGETSSLFVLNLSSVKTSQENFEKMMQNYANSKKIELKSLVAPIPAGNGKTYRVFEFPFPSMPGIWLGETFDFAKARYATFYDDYLVFASSQKVLQEYLADMELGYSLDNDRAYSDFIRTSDTKANIYAFANLSRLLPLSNHLLNSNAGKIVEKSYSETFQKVNLLSWQIICEKDIYFNSIHLGRGKQSKSDGSELWATNLGAELAMKPQIVENHNNPSEKDIIVQDEDYRLHLVSANGQIRWTIPVNGKILGEIHQIDYLRNGKWQFLFNTREKLYLIDINGNNVTGFPVSFDSPATNGVSVFDYDNNRKYRYFLAFENRKVMALDQNGKPVSGWNFSKTESTITTPIQHFRVNNKDYIVFKDAGKIYIQDRRGETRVKTPVQFENSENLLILNLNGTPKIVATDKNGKVYYIYFDGKYAEKNVGNFSAKHFFTIDDLDGNNIPDFIFVDGNKLTVTDENGKNLYEEKLDNDITVPPSVYTFSTHQKLVGVTDSKGNRIYLFKPDGKQNNGFPFRGNSAFSIGNIISGQLCLVVGNNDELVCFGLK